MDVYLCHSIIGCAGGARTECETVLPQARPHLELCEGVHHRPRRAGHVRLPQAAQDSGWGVV